MSSLRIVRAGMLTTVQDLGRWGCQAHGVPVAGPMDIYSHRLANRLVGNEDHCAALEITLVGPEIEAAGDVVCAVAGAEFEMSVDGRHAPQGRPFVLKTGDRLRFGRRESGARATLAVRGGIDAPIVLGSRATSLVSGMGPFGGRRLLAGDVLPVGQATARETSARLYSLSLPQGGARLRAMPGPHDAAFTDAALDRFFSESYVVTVNSNRMGYRLEGPPLSHAGSSDILSDATPVGSVQVPKSGQPILLMADRQTTGGYPKIATVITADLPLAGQLAPGDWIRFAPCTRSEAIDALHRLERRLGGESSQSL
ncbi:MAG: biotin-dependent carboxyltransferase family protein [Vicinamibacterales bacterium]